MVILPDIKAVRSVYDCRIALHQQLLALIHAAKEKEFAELAIGVTNFSGCNANYSANLHLLGNKILASNNFNYSVIFKLAQKLMVSNYTHVPNIIYDAAISHLKISVGSEMAMMLKPDELWVGNIRTYWIYFLVQNGFDKKGIKAANDAVRLFKNNEQDSILEYKIWRDLYLALQNPLTELARKYKDENSKSISLIPVENKYLWADAIATHLYEYYVK